MCKLVPYFADTQLAFFFIFKIVFGKTTDTFGVIRNRVLTTLRFDTDAIEHFEARLTHITFASGPKQVRIFALITSENIVTTDTIGSNFLAIKTHKCDGIYGRSFLTESAIHFVSRMIAGNTFSNIDSTSIAYIVERVAVRWTGDTGSERGRWIGDKVRSTQ